MPEEEPGCEAILRWFHLSINICTQSESLGVTGRDSSSHGGFCDREGEYVYLLKLCLAKAERPKYPKLCYCTRVLLNEFHLYVHELVFTIEC